MELLFFHGPWCQPCIETEPNIEAVSNKTGVPLSKYSMDDDNHVRVADAYRVRSVPTIILINDDNDEIDRLNGYQTKHDICEMIKKYV